MTALHSVSTIHEKLGHAPSRTASKASLAALAESLNAPGANGHPLTTSTSDGFRPSLDGDESAGGPIMRTLSKRSPWGALLSRTLPEYKGPHRVGVFDMEIPVQEPRNIGTFVHSRLANAEPGFKLETVLFSVFYPAEEKRSLLGKVIWFPRLSQTVNGFLKMARRTGWLYKTFAYPIAAAAIYGTTFPANAEAPLKKPPAGEKWPLVIFSHGVGTSRLMYSSFCGELASRGYIVCAVEHRDGTGPSSSIKLLDGSLKDVDFVGWQDVSWPQYSPDQQPKDDTRLRHDQLEMRKAEIEEIIRAMKGITAGEPIIETSIRSPDFDWERWGPKWDAIDPHRPIMTGHSLGGSAALLAAADRERFDFQSIVAFDPAIQRLEPWGGEIPCPFLCINSEEFTRSTDFERLQNLARTAQNPPIYSISGSTHPSFSDVFLIVPGFINRRTGLRVAADEMLDTTMNITLAFLEGEAKHSRTYVTEWEGSIMDGTFGDPGSVNWHPVISDEEVARRQREREAESSTPAVPATVEEAVANHQLDKTASQTRREDELIQ